MVVLLRSSLNIDIFKISLSISISTSIFLKYFLSISISISIFSKTTISISISISIFLELPYRYRYFSKVSIYRQSICHIDISNRAIHNPVEALVTISRRLDLRLSGVLQIHAFLVEIEEQGDILK